MHSCATNSASRPSMMHTQSCQQMDCECKCIATLAKKVFNAVSSTRLRRGDESGSDRGRIRRMLEMRPSKLDFEYDAVQLSLLRGRRVSM